jgi:outer membrane protein TolC
MRLSSFFIFFICISILPYARSQVESLNVDQTRAYALRHAPSLAKQRLTASNLVENIVIARSKFDPLFTLRRNWSDEEDPGLSSGSIRQTLPADLDVTLSSSYEEDSGLTRHAVRLSKTLLGGGTRAESRLPIDRALAAEALQANTLSLEERRLALSVTRQFYGIVRDQLTLHLREVQIERAKRNLEHAMVKEDPLDIATARLRIPESELDALSARRAIETGLLALRNEIGMPLTQSLTVNTQLVFSVRAVDPETDLRRALDQHERILNARLDLEISKLEAKVARSKRLPTLNAQLTAEERDGGGEETDSDLTGELVLEWPWMDRADRAEARKSQSDIRAAEITQFEVEQEIRRDIQTTLLRLVEAEQSIVLQEERVRVLEQQLRLYLDRWENGEINILEYIRSQNNLEDARVQLVTQQSRYMELLAEYDFNVGR